MITKIILNRMLSVAAVTGCLFAVVQAGAGRVQASVLLNTYTGGNSGTFYFNGTSNFTATQSSNFGSSTAYEMINGTGFYTNLTVANYGTGSPTFVDNTPVAGRSPDHDNQTTDGWLSDGSLGPAAVGLQWAAVDLQSPYLLDTMRLWNANAPTTRGVDTAYIWYSTDANPLITATIGGVSPGGAWTKLSGPGANGIFTIGPASGGFTDDQYTDISFGGIPVRDVLIDVESSYGDSYVGLAGAQFFGTLPEPASISLLGVGAVALLSRRRAGFRAVK